MQRRARFDYILIETTGAVALRGTSANKLTVLLNISSLVLLEGGSAVGEENKLEVGVCVHSLIDPKSPSCETSTMIVPEQTSLQAAGLAPSRAGGSGAAGGRGAGSIMDLDGLLHVNDASSA